MYGKIRRGGADGDKRAAGRGRAGGGARIDRSPAGW